ncbi:MAG: hypothetical protein KC656_33015 [Myxococcales bacterium]|nr:hypothetical protein [Myxococcales bacterium]MCB9670595.1 hypothetical protein [Alphaproteobacteria bacterium]MCB9691912.1 hypothetical protein [Alphaproteobacteria bacterium]
MTLELTPDALGPGDGLRWLDDHRVLVVRGFWSSERAREAVQAVLAARDRWVADFDGKQFAVGRAWYAHLETDRASDYFATAGQGDQDVEAVVPGLQDAMRAALERLVGAPVVQRPRWAGAGIHVFPSGGVCADHGGCVHFDHEGLTPAQKDARPPALSLVLILQQGRAGGGLKLWDVLLGEPEVARGEPVEVRGEPGDLVVFSSHRLHQIQPFDGPDARISATLHGADVFGGWESWF